MQSHVFTLSTHSYIYILTSKHLLTTARARRPASSCFFSLQNSKIIDRYKKERENARNSNNNGNESDDAIVHSQKTSEHIGR